MDNRELLQLISKYLAGEATAQEAAFVERYYAYFDLADAAVELTEEQWEQLSLDMKGVIDKRIKEIERPVTIPLYKRKQWRWMAAAVVSVLMVLGILFYMKPTSSDRQKQLADAGKSAQTDIAPGGNKATLTLENGSMITLDTAKNGRLADQDAATILKVADGQLTYDAIEQPTRVVQYNVLSTPRGGQYAVTLPDGSKAWLNAISTIRFPTAFTGKERTVEITGEVYFEVAKNPHQPFIASVGGVKVEALGTQFNVNAYKDENLIATTLIEGKVRVTSDHTEHTIQPGEQVTVDHTTGEAVLHPSVDVEAVAAWKNGLTVFKSRDIQSIMRQLSRWYDVDIEYEGKVPTQTFTGTISRNAPLSAVLNMLEYAGIHFTIADRKILVKP